MKLKLADGTMYRTLSDAIDDNYINVPTPDGQGFIRVREDYFDNLPPVQWNAVMDELAPYNSGMNGLFSKWKAKRAEKKAIRQENRAARVEKRRDFFRDVTGQIVGAVTGNVPGDAIQGDIMYNGPGSQLPGEPKPVDQFGRAFTFGYTDVEPQPWYTKPAVLIGGAAVVLGGAYLLTRGKKAKK